MGWGLGRWDGGMVIGIMDIGELLRINDRLSEESWFVDTLLLYSF